MSMETPKIPRVIKDKGSRDFDQIPTEGLISDKNNEEKLLSKHIITSTQSNNFDEIKEKFEEPHNAKIAKLNKELLELATDSEKNEESMLLEGKSKEVVKIENEILKHEAIKKAMNPDDPSMN